jgi:hypothetical protein
MEYVALHTPHESIHHNGDSMSAVDNVPIRDDYTVHYTDGHQCTTECPLFLCAPPQPRLDDTYTEFIRRGRSQ